MPPYPYPFALVTPATRGLSLALTRHILRHTKLPVYATYRKGSDDEVHKHIMSELPADVNPKRLTVLPLELRSEESIADAARNLEKHLAEHTNGDLKNAYLQTGFFTGGVLYPERQPRDLVLEEMRETFEVNTLSHLLLIKHFSRFLPPRNSSQSKDEKLSKWVHVSARVGSVSDNRLGGWYSYRASKAALNQVVKTFDLFLKTRRQPAIAVGVHPGTVKTDLSKDFWSGVKKEKLFEAEYAADRLINVVGELTEDKRGRIWDWKGEEIIP